MKLIFRNRVGQWQQMGDDALLASYRKSGDMEIVEELFNRYGHLVLGICLKYLKEEEEAKDACMQIFEKLIADLLISNVVQFKSWIYTVARNHCLIHIRKTISLERHKENYLKNFPEEFVNFWLEMNHTNEAELEMNNLHLAMDKLDKEHKLCLDLIYFQGKSYKEITEITGYEPNQVKSYIQNGKRNLKNILERAYGKE